MFLNVTKQKQNAGCLTFFSSKCGTAHFFMGDDLEVLWMWVPQQTKMQI